MVTVYVSPRLRRTVGALICAAALAGCGTMAPVYQRPDSATPASLPTSDTDRASNASADLPWREAFTDPTLQRLIALALDNNRDLRVSLLNVEKARAQYQVERAALLPTINATADGSAARTPASYAGTTAASTTHQYNVGVGAASYEVDLFGRVRSLRDQALQTYLGTEEARRAAQVTLVGEVATAYLTWSSDAGRYARLPRNAAASISRAAASSWAQHRRST